MSRPYDPMAVYLLDLLNLLSFRTGLVVKQFIRACRARRNLSLTLPSPADILPNLFLAVEPHGQARGTHSRHAFRSMAGGDIPEAGVYFIPG